MNKFNSIVAAALLACAASAQAAIPSAKIQAMLAKPADGLE